MDIRATVESRLKSLGYEVTEADDFAIDYAISKAEAKLKAEVNQSSVPDGLFYVWADLAAGVFLQDQKATGRLTGFDLSAPVKSVSEGDTSVTYAIADTNNPDTVFEALIKQLTTLDEFVLAAYRRLAW